MKYPDDFINKIIHGDCLEVMKYVPDNAINLVLTDPPYGIKFEGKGYTEIESDKYPIFLNAIKHFPIAIMNYPEECMRYFVPNLGVPNDVITWVYNSNTKRQHRMICIYGKNVNWSGYKQLCKNPTDSRVNQYVDSYDWFSDIQQVKNVSKDKTSHPCQLPIELVRRLILMLTKEGDVVLDPFLGSGTTAVACKQLNRNFIGIEINKTYCEIAERRLSQEYIF